MQLKELINERGENFFADQNTADLARSSGQGVQDINQIKGSRDEQRTSLDPDLASSKPTQQTERKNVYKETIDSLQNLELYFVRSDDPADVALRDQVSQLRKDLIARVKQTIPPSATTGPVAGGMSINIGIGGVAS